MHFCTMFGKLQQKWKVGSRDLVLILCTFAVTGTLTAWISRQITGWLQVEHRSFGWWGLKIGVLLFGYQFIILIIGFCFGQFRFFWNYEKKILRRLGLWKRLEKPEAAQQSSASLPEQKKQVAIFASGGGSNAEQIIRHFQQHPHINISLIVCNKPGAGVLRVADEYSIGSLLIEKIAFQQGHDCLAELQRHKTDFIVLAGFLWKVPVRLINAYPGKIINIHPALLPLHGGQGMYGHHVHEAVLAAGDTETGITIHLVDEQYDHGNTLFQARCPVLPGDTPASLADRVRQLEHTHYPVVIEEWVLPGT